MSNVLTTVSTGIATAEKDLEKTFTFVSHIYTAVESRMNTFLKDEPQVVSALADLMEKGEVFLATSAPAISAKGLSLPADSAAFAAFQTFWKSFESAATVLKGVIGEMK